jgi:molybdenum cofactor cytidylyltransferase
VPNFSLGVIVLAAGASVRMGKPKLLLPWGNTTILGHVLEFWKDSQAAQIAVVHSPNNPSLCFELDRLLVPPQNRISNVHPEEGMFSSVVCAARWRGWNPDVTHHVIVLGDQPHLPINLLHCLIEFAMGNPEVIVQPSFRGRPRHPVILPRSEFEALANSNEKTLKSFLQDRSANVRLFPSDDPALEYDIDTPEDYEKALKLFRPRGL